jgi:hypothetical protein
MVVKLMRVVEWSGLILSVALFSCWLAPPLLNPMTISTVTAPSTMVPSRTPTALPTPTSVPTDMPVATLPSWLSEMHLPRKAVAPEDWPSLPVDLYFIREGRLWHWPAEGGVPQALPVAAGDPVRWYRLLPDSAGVIYCSETRHLYWVEPPSPGGDRSWSLVWISDEPAREYRLIRDGQALIYLTESAHLGSVELSSSDLMDDGIQERVLSSDPVRSYLLTSDELTIVYLTQDGRLFANQVLSSDSASLTLTAKGLDVRDFTVSPDGQYVVYQSAEGFYFLDVGSGSLHFLAETLSQHQFTPDNQHLVYLVGETIYALDVQMPDDPFVVGSCLGGRDDACDVRCGGFTVSPDGESVIYVDARGLWTARLLEGEPQLRMKNGGDWQPCGPIVGLGSWSPDGRVLLLERAYWEGDDLALLHVDTGQTWVLPGSFCYVECYREWRWHSQGLWVTHSTYVGGSIYLAQVTAGGELEIVDWLSPDDERMGICPVSLHPLSDGRLAFIHPGYCEGAGFDSEVAPAIFTISAERELERVVLLPTFERRYGSDDVLLWSPDGDAFLYAVEVYDGSRPMGQAPVLLGLTDGSALWDVRGLLVSATDLRWGTPR